MTFETFLAAGRPDPKTRRAMRWALGLALGVHVLLLAAAMVHAGWRVEEVTAPAVPIKFAGFVTPPPPPPPAGPAERVRRTPRRTVPTRQLVQPVDQPDRTDTPDPPSTEPGVAGGQPGGAIGGVIGGTDPGPPAPPTFVAPNVATGQLAIDPHADPYRVKLPPALSRAGMRIWLLAKICVRADGQVDRVSLLRGADPTLDPLVVATLQTWRYRPYAVNGRPVPFCTNVRYEIATQ
jgi:protein TonB